jgi:hypothetical protein
MPTADTAAVITELKQLGLHAELLPADRVGTDLDSINVWEDPAERYPLTTVWPPRPSQDGDGWAWGPSFQFGAHADDDAETVAHKVSRTIETILGLVKGKLR